MTGGAELTAGGDPNLSLKDYDHRRFGPFLGVSDEGSAAPEIVAAALASPKSSSLQSPGPLEVGVAHDAERLGSIGEVPVGPDEYRRIIEAAGDRILISTNIGSHVNLWHYLRLPVIAVDTADADELDRRVADQLTRFKPPSSGGLRVATAYLELPPGSAREDSKESLAALERARRAGHFGDPESRSLALVAGSTEPERVRADLELAAAAGLLEVAVDATASGSGPARPGILDSFAETTARELLSFAAERGVRLRPRDVMDTETIARQVWTGLHAARSMRLDLGKYGLFPLTFQQMDRVIGHVQGWFADWTAAPAFYIDMPAQDGDRVYGADATADAVLRWLEIVAGHGVPVVLIDTVDKAAGRSLIAADGKGFLTWEELEELHRAADDLGVRALWAGGITLDQVFRFGALGVFGIYVTTAAARRQPVTPDYEEDVALPEEREPSREGVARVKLLLEAGFMSTRGAGDGAAMARAAEGVARGGEVGALAEIVTDAWTEGGKT